MDGMNTFLIKPRASHLRLFGIGLILCACVAYSIGPFHTWYRGRQRGGVWSGLSTLPYNDILVVQCVGPWFVLMVLAAFAGCILLIFGKPLARDFARLPEMTAKERTSLLNAAAVTVGLYALLVAVYGVVVEYQHGRLDAYAGFSPLQHYAARIAMIALIFFPFAKGANSRWLLLLGGILLYFWAS